MKNALLPLHLTLIALALQVGGAQPLPGRPELYCGGLLRLNLPEGWQAQEAPDQPLTLRPPGDERPLTVEHWPIPRGGLAAARGAAAAHESALFEQTPYRRLTATPVKARDGLEGLLVTGEVLNEDGQTARTAFAAFAGGGNYWIIATRYPAEAGLTAPPALLLDVVDRLELVATETPAPTPAPEPTPVAPVGPQPLPATPPQPVTPAPEPLAPEPLPAVPPTPAPQPAPTPDPAPQPLPPGPEPVVVQPAPTPPPPQPVVPVTDAPVPVAPEPTPAPGTPRAPQPAITPVPAVRDDTPPAPAPKPEIVHTQSPLGFTLDHPATWQLQLVEGHIEVLAPPAPGSATPAAAVIIWPVSQIAAGQDPVALGRALLARSEANGAQADSLRARSQDDAAVLAGTVGQGPAARNVVASCHVVRDQGLLTAILARPEEFTRQLPLMLAMLDSFSGGPWWADAAAPTAATTLWQDPVQGWLRLPVPENWRVRGQLLHLGEAWGLQLELDSTDGRGLRCLWRQPVQPMFRDLTPVLRNLGWQEGDRYPANVKDNQLRVMARLQAQDFLTRVWLREGSVRLEDVVLDRVTMSPAAAALAGARNASGAVALLHGDLQGQPRQRQCVVATADATVGGEPNCWQAAVLEAEAPPGSIAEAVAVLQGIVEGALVANGAPEPAATALHDLIRAARTALVVTPGTPVGETKWVDVLSVRNDQARGRLWLLPAAALSPWRRAAGALAAGQQVGAIMPELDADYWK